MCFLPRRALNVSDCEIARAYKLCSSSIEPIAFIVPRKVGIEFLVLDLAHVSQSDSFQSDIFPAAPSSEAALTAGEFFAGKTAPPNLINLETGIIYSGTQSAFTPSTPQSSGPVAPSPNVQQVPPTRTYTAPAPAVFEEPESISRAPVPEPTPLRASFEATPVTRSQSNGGDVRLVDIISSFVLLIGHVCRYLRQPYGRRIPVLQVSFAKRGRR
jgi:coronin-1B/1C/6